MVFGNFKGDSTEVITSRPDDIFPFTQIDNFALYEVDSLKQVNLTICPGEEYILPYYELTGMFYIIDGDTLGKELPGLTTGNYLIEQHLDGCRKFHEFNLEVKPCGDNCRTELRDTTICAFDNLTAPDGAYYQFEGQTIDSMYYFNPGEYHLAAGDSLCGIFSEFKLKVLPCTDCVEINWRDTILCKDEMFELWSSELINDITIQMDGMMIQEENSIKFDSPGVYTLRLESNKCQLSLPIQILVEDCSACPVYIPNAFTPNGDGINDEFKIFTECEWKDFQLKIYNRWGALLYTSYLNKPWDGKVKGSLVEQGLYIYDFKGAMKFGREEKLVKKSGEIMVIR